MLTTRGWQLQSLPRHQQVSMSQHQRSRSVPGSVTDRNREELIALRQQVEANLVSGRLNRQRCFREDEADLSSTLEIVADLPEDGTAALDLANKLLTTQVPRSFGHKLSIELCSSISRIQARCGVLRDCLRTKCEQCLNIAEVIEDYDAKRSAENKRRRDREARRGNPPPGPDGAGLYQTTLQQVGIAVRGGPALTKAKKGPVKLSTALAETTMKYSASSSSSTSSDASMASVAKKVPRRSPRLKNETPDTATTSESSAVPAEPKPEPNTSANVATPPILPVSPVVAPPAPTKGAKDARPESAIELVQIDGESGTSGPTSASGSSASSPSDNLFGSASSTVSEGDKQIDQLTQYANDLATASPDIPAPPLPAASSPEAPRRGIQRRASMIDEYIPWQGWPTLDPVEIHDQRERRYGTAYGDALREAMEADNELTVLTLIKR